MIYHHTGPIMHIIFWWIFVSPIVAAFLWPILRASDIADRKLGYK